MGESCFVPDSRWQSADRPDSSGVEPAPHFPVLWLFWLVLSPFCPLNFVSIIRHVWTGLAAIEIWFVKENNCYCLFLFVFWVGNWNDSYVQRYVILLVTNWRYNLNGRDNIFFKNSVHVYSIVMRADPLHLLTFRVSVHGNSFDFWSKMKHLNWSNDFVL